MTQEELKVKCLDIALYNAKIAGKVIDIKTLIDEAEAILEWVNKK